MGFLDAFSSNDPQSEAMRQGLLRMGLALMQAKGNPGDILGQAGTEGVNGMQSFQDRQFKQKLQQEALAEIARKKVIQGREDTAYEDAQNLSLLPSQFARNATQMGNQATLAQTGNLSPTVGNAAIQSANAQPGFDYPGLIQKYLATKGGLPNALALQAAIKKDTTPISAGPGVTLVDPQTRKPFFTNPANPHADSPDIQALAQLYGKGTTEYNAALKVMLDKKNDPIEPGFKRDATGKLTVDPEWLRVKKELAAIAPNINATARLTHGIQALTPEQNQALFGPNGAVTTGRLDPNRINSRTASIFAAAELANPGSDLSRISADIALSRNPTYRARAQTAEVLPEIMTKMVEAGKVVGFSDVKVVGRMQAFLKGELNDPDLAEYMALRNDGLMTIASTMRGIGMSDQAHRAEIEAQNPTMSPGALDGWLRGQMKSLEPRLKQYRAITGPHPGTRDASPASTGGWSITPVN